MRERSASPGPKRGHAERARNLFAFAPFDWCSSIQPVIATTLCAVFFAPFLFVLNMMEVPNPGEESDFNETVHDLLAAESDALPLMYVFNTRASTNSSRSIA